MRTTTRSSTRGSTGCGDWARRRCGSVDSPQPVQLLLRPYGSDSRMSPLWMNLPAASSALGATHPSTKQRRGNGSEVRMRSGSGSNRTRLNFYSRSMHLRSWRVRLWRVDAVRIGFVPVVPRVDGFIQSDSFVLLQLLLQACE